MVSSRPRLAKPGRHLGAVEHALLEVAAVRQAPDLAAQRVHFVHQLRLRGAPNRRVARLRHGMPRHQHRCLGVADNQGE